MDELDDIPTFAARIKTKFPDYADIPDADLVEKVVRKHPAYADQVQLPDSFSLLQTSTGYPKLDSVYEQAGREHNVDPNLLLSQGRQETINFKPSVMYGKQASPAGALGAGQFMPDTAPKYGVTDRTDPIQSINGQAKYMRKLLDQFDNNEDLALAGYNAGEYRKSLANGKVPNIPETQNYVKTISGELQKARATGTPLRDLISNSQDQYAAVNRPLMAPADSTGGQVVPPATPITRTVPSALAGVDPSQLFNGTARVDPGVALPTVKSPLLLPDAAQEPNAVAQPQTPPQATQTPVQAVPQPTQPSVQTPSATPHGTQTSEPAISAENYDEQGNVIPSVPDQSAPPQQAVNANDAMNAVADTITLPSNITDKAHANAYIQGQLAAKYNVSPETLAKGDFLGDYTPGKPVQITYGGLTDLGVDTAPLIRQKVAENRVENPTPDLSANAGGFTPEDTKETIGQPLAAFATEGLSSILPEDTQKWLGAKLASAGAAGGGRVATALGGLLTLARASNPLVIGGAVDSNVGDNVLTFFKDTGSRTAQFNQQLALKGADGEETWPSKLVDIAGGLPADLSRLAILSKLPTGAILGFGADAALQASGQGAPASEVLKQGAKGTALGLLFAGSGFLGKAAESVAPKVLTEGLTLGTIAGGSYALGKAFGDSDNQAFSEAVVNSLFHVVGKTPEMVEGKTIHVRAEDGQETTVKVENGKVETVAADTPADVEMLIPRGTLQKYFNKDAAIQSTIKTSEAKGNVVVPETAPEPERQYTSQLDEIRQKDADTKAKIKEIFPQLSNEEAADLRRQAFPAQESASAQPPDKTATAEPAQTDTVLPETPKTLEHPNEAINGKPILAETADGKVVVENPDNVAGVSIVKNRAEGETVPVETGDTESKPAADKPDIKSEGVKEELPVKEQTYITHPKELKKASADVRDLAEELLDNKAQITPDGKVVLYHRTTPEQADQIQKTGKMRGEEDGLFFSTIETGQNEGYGKSVIRMEVPLSKLELDDVFGNEAHVRIPLRKAGEIADVKAYLSRESTPESKVTKTPIVAKESEPASTAEKITNIKPVLGKGAVAEEPPKIPTEQKFTSEPKGEPSSIMNREVNTARENRGWDKLSTKLKLSNPELHEQAKAAIAKDPKAPIKTYEKFREHPDMAPTKVESVLLNAHYLNEKADWQEMVNRYTKAMDSNDPLKMADARMERKIADAKLDTAERVLRRAGTETAQSLQSRQMFADEDFEFTQLAKNYKMAKGSEPSSGELKRLQEIADEHKAKSDALATMLAGKDEEIANIQAQLPPRHILDVAENYVKKLHDLADKEREKLRAKGNVFQAGIDPRDLKSMAIIGADHLANMSLDFAKWSDKMVDEFGDKIKPHLDDIFEQAKQVLQGGHAELKTDANRISSALRGQKTRMENRIKELENAINKRERITRNRTTIKPDAELEKLQERVKSLKEDYDATFPKEPRPPMSDAQRLKALEKRLEKKQKTIQEKVQNQDFSEPVKRDALNPMAIKQDVSGKYTPEERAQATRIIAAQAEVGKIEKRYARMKSEAERANEPLTKWVQRKLINYVRGSMLSAVSVIEKLGAASAGRIVTRPVKTAIGAAVSKVIPGIAEKAAIEGSKGLKNDFQNEANAVAKAVTTGIMDIGRTLTGRGTSISNAFGKKENYLSSGRYASVEASQLIGLMHDSLKAPAFRSEFEGVMGNLIMNEKLNDRPIDNETLFVLGQRAYDYAQRVKFGESRKLTDAIQKHVLDPLDNNELTPIQAIGTFLHIVMPIHKIATNVIAQSFESSPFGLTKGLVKAGAAKIKGIDNLSPDQADIIMRNIKNGTFGTAMYALGLFGGGKVIGSFYQKYDKDEDKNKAKYNTVQIGGYRIPAALLHLPEFNSMFMGATTKRIYEEDLAAKDKEGASKYTPSEAKFRGIGGGVAGLVNEVPGVEAADALVNIYRAIFGGDAEQMNESRYGIGNFVAGRAVPGLVRNTAEWFDQDPQGHFTTPFTREPYNRKGNYGTFGQSIKTQTQKNIPGWRNQLPNNTPR